MSAVFGLAARLQAARAAPLRTARRAVLYSAAGGAALLAGEAWYVRLKFRLPPDASGPLSGVVEPRDGGGSSSGGGSSARGGEPRRRNIVFLGDSLVTGVGCSAEVSATVGHVLPRHVAELLAAQLGESIGWTCVGETGADVSMLRTRLLPRLQSEVRRVSASGDGQRVDAVVVMTGLNDIKECLLFANPRLHPWKFCELMEALLCSVREVAGGHCALLVAGCPIEAVPRFNDLWPLSAATRVITRLWEDKKREAAEAADARIVAERGRGGVGEGYIAFLVPPPSMVRRLLDGAAYFAADGMHPNDAGYVVWAEIIASELLAKWQAEATEPK